MTGPSSRPSYRALLAVPGMRRMLGSLLCSRTAGQMASVVLVLFVLARYRSPQLSGLTVLLSIVPGLLLSPLAGAVLDRGARVPLIVLDYLIAGTALAAIVGLAEGGLLQAWSLLLIAALQSLTAPLSNSGTRSLFPVLVPRSLWDRANAVDSATMVVATVTGPGLAGLAVAVVGPTYALLLPALLSFAAAVVVLGLQVPAPRAEPESHVLREAWAGLVYVVRNRGLRALAVTLSVYNLAGGGLVVAMPVLVLTRLHGGSTEVGALFAVMGLGGLVAGLLVGCIDSEGRERELMLLGCAITTAALLLLAVVQSTAVAVLAMALVGVANGPLDIGLFSLRQRVTDPAWFGRAFAVSMSVNFIGFPVGSALAGPVVAHSISAALALGAGFAALSFLAPLLLLPSQRGGSVRSPADKAAAS